MLIDWLCVWCMLPDLCAFAQCVKLTGVVWHVCVLACAGPLTVGVLAVRIQILRYNTYMATNNTSCD